MASARENTPFSGSSGEGLTLATGRAGFGGAGSTGAWVASAVVVAVAVGVALLAAAAGSLRRIFFGSGARLGGCRLAGSEQEDHRGDQTREASSKTGRVHRDSFAMSPWGVKRVRKGVERRQGATARLVRDTRRFDLLPGATP